MTRQELMRELIGQRDRLEDIMREPKWRLACGNIAVFDPQYMELEKQLSDVNLAIWRLPD